MVLKVVVDMSCKHRHHVACMNLQLEERLWMLL